MGAGYVSIVSSSAGPKSLGWFTCSIHNEKNLGAGRGGKKRQNETSYACRVHKSCIGWQRSLSHAFQGFIYPRWCRISSIDSMWRMLIWFPYQTSWSWMATCGSRMRQDLETKLDSQNWINETYAKIYCNISNAPLKCPYFVVALSNGFVSISQYICVFFNFKDDLHHRHYPCIIKMLLWRQKGGQQPQTCKPTNTEQHRIKCICRISCPKPQKKNSTPGPSPWPQYDKGGSSTTTEGQRSRMPGKVLRGKKKLW